MTGEHVWPVWSHAIVNYGGKGRVRELHTHVADRPVREPIERRKESPLHQLELRVVCRSCNSGWMSKVEEAAKPHLIPLLKGESCTITVEGQQAITRWAAMKVMVVEHDHPHDLVTPAIDRRALMEGGEVPFYFDIRIARHDMDSTAALKRNAVTIFFDVDEQVPVPAKHPIKNVQSVSFIIGKLVFVIGASRSNKSIEELFGVVPNALPRIWPQLGTPLPWPPPMTLRKEHTVALGDRLAALDRANDVQWAQHPFDPI